MDIFLTCGIGDCFALESHFPADLCPAHIYYALPSFAEVSGYMARVFPQAKHIQLWSDFTDRRCFFLKKQLDRQKHLLPADWPTVEDWGIVVRFQQIFEGRYPYRGSTALRQHMANPKVFLPARFMAVVPLTVSSPQHRCFDAADWDTVLDLLRQHNCYGVILNSANEAWIPDNPRLINLSGHLSLFESVEVLKQAMGYCGIDSCLSVLAAQLFDADKLWIKCRQQAKTWAQVYYAPHTTFDFLRDR